MGLAGEVQRILQPTADDTCGDYMLKWESPGGWVVVEPPHGDSMWDHHAPAHYEEEHLEDGYISEGSRDEAMLRRGDRPEVSYGCLVAP